MAKEMRAQEAAQAKVKSIKKEKPKKEKGIDFVFKSLFFISLQSY